MTNAMSWLWKMFKNNPTLTTRTTRNPFLLSPRHKRRRRRSHDVVVFKWSIFRLQLRSATSCLFLLTATTGRLWTRMSQLTVAPPSARHIAVHSSTRLLPNTAGNHDWRARRPMRSAAESSWISQRPRSVSYRALETEGAPLSSLSKPKTV